MAKSIFEELEELLFVDKGELTYRAKARSARVRGNLPIIEPSESSGRFKGFGQKNGTAQRNAPGQRNDKNERAELESFTLSLPPSSTIQTATYWPKQKYLTVSFKSGQTYSYDDVPYNVIMAWRLAPSAGSHFYYNIRTKFNYRKI
jgi:hypothetical protein